MAGVIEREDKALLREIVTEALRSLAESASKLERVAKGEVKVASAEKSSAKVAVRTK